MSRYWRLVNLLTDSGALSLSEVSLYDGATKIAATANAPVAPSSGALSLLNDGLADVAATWERCTDPGFSLTFDALVSYESVQLRLGSGAGVADYPHDLTLQTSSDLLTWVTSITYAHIAWPGAFSLTPASSMGPDVVVADPFYSSVSLLLPGDGPNGSVTFTDKSQAPKQVIMVGTPRISTAQSKFGGASIVFDSAGSYLKCASAAPVGTEDFTLEGWFYAPTLPAAGSVRMLAHWLSVGGINFELTNTGALGCYSFSPIGYFSGGYAPPGQFNHAALVRFGNVFSIYINGIVVGSMGLTANFSVADLEIGFDSTTPSRTWNGHIDDFRVTRGVARYKANFSPPIAAFSTDSSGVSDWIAFEPLPRRLRLSVPRPDQYLPAVALPDSSAMSHAHEFTFADLCHGGLGVIAATVKEKGTPTNVPLRRRVLLLDERSHLVIRETWSDAITGNYEFRGVKQGVKYTVISYDHLHNYRAVIADNQDAT